MQRTASSPISHALLCTLVLALAQPALSLAQFPGGGGMGGGRMGGGGMRGAKGAPPNAADAAPAVHRFLPDEVDERLYLLQEDLHLTREQQPFWDRYADAVRAGAKDVERDRVRNEARDQPPVMQRLDRLAESSRNRLTAIEDVVAAAKSLYGVMTPAQRDTSDPRLATLTALLMDSSAPAAPASASRRR